MEKDESCEPEAHTAIKWDRGKADLSLLPYEALCEIARGFMEGANKYGRYNFREGMEIHRYIAAAMRHLGQFNNGMDIDTDSGVSHLALACCNCIMAFTNLQEKPNGFRDTRYRGSVSTRDDTRYRRKSSIRKADRQEKIPIDDFPSSIGYSITNDDTRRDEVYRYTDTGEEVSRKVGVKVSYEGALQDDITGKDGSTSDF